MPLPGQLSMRAACDFGSHRRAGTASRSAFGRGAVTLSHEIRKAAGQCLASSVRLKIEDADGNSVGSGTIIDARAGEALVLTCGHIFRESQGGRQY